MIETRLPSRRRMDEGKSNFVYVVAGEPYDGWAKIGRVCTADLMVTRLQGLQTGNPRKLRIAALWETPGRISIETDVHRHFRALRGCGEWFALPREFLAECGDLDPYGGNVFRLLGEWPAERVLDGADDASPEALALVFSQGAIGVLAE